MLPRLSHFLDCGVLLLLKSPEERSKSIGASKGFTTVLGAADLAGALGVGAGVAHAGGGVWADPGHARSHPEYGLLSGIPDFLGPEGGKYVLMK
jgi:hypothetical protein